jgi:ElaB/YqjD/DUF883 family membrane-anchored ribosome-binding protein
MGDDSGDEDNLLHDDDDDDNNVTATNASVVASSSMLMDDELERVQTTATSKAPRTFDHLNDEVKKRVEAAMAAADEPTVEAPPPAYIPLPESTVNVFVHALYDAVVEVLTYLHFRLQVEQPTNCVLTPIPVYCINE